MYYSWWIVPHNYTKIMKMYKMFHIPHVTIKTRMLYPQSNKLIGKEFDMKFTEEMRVFKEGVGFSCEVENMGVYMMIVHYDTQELLEIESPGTTKGIFCCADTQSPYEELWTIEYPDPRIKRIK